MRLGLAALCWLTHYSIRSEAFTITLLTFNWYYKLLLNTVLRAVFIRKLLVNIGTFGKANRIYILYGAF